MDDDILKQRRNLMIISMMLILFDFADVTIAKVGVLGTDLIVGNPRVLIAFAWVIWAYFLLRYYQYWRQDQRSLFTQALYEGCRRYAGRYTRSKAFQKKHNGISHVDLKYDSSWSLRLIKSEYRPKEGGSVEVFSVGVPFWRTFLWKLKSVFHFVVHTPHFTDNALPFVVALAAPIVTVATNLGA